MQKYTIPPTWQNFFSSCTFCYSQTVFLKQKLSGVKLVLCPYQLLTISLPTPTAGGDDTFLNGQIYHVLTFINKVQRKYSRLLTSANFNISGVTGWSVFCTIFKIISFYVNFFRIFAVYEKNKNHTRNCRSMLIDSGL